MKKNSFIKDSFITTMGVVVCKVIGLFYVIPFYKMITNSGGALYSYAYSIYAIFISISTGGLPVAISKLISEYNALKCYYTSERIYKIGVRIMNVIGIASFLIMFIFAKTFASSIMGEATGGNTIEDIATVIRVISTALLVVPIYSITKGYLQGNKMFKETSLANIIEQLVRVAIILLSCFIIIKILKLDEKIAIYLSVFAATVGAFTSYAYLFIKSKKYRKNKEVPQITIKEKKINNTYIIKKILGCAIPFIVIDVLRSAFTTVDTFTVVKGLTALGFDANTAENTLSVIATWGNKINTIVISLASGFCISLIPNIASSNALKDYNSVNSKITQSIKALMLLVLPATVGLFFLAKPVWIVFYGYNELCVNVYRMTVFTATTFSFFLLLLNINQTLGNTKINIITLVISFVLNAIFNIPMINLCHNIGIPAYYGATINTILIEALACLVLLIYLKKQLKIKFKDTFIVFIKILLSCFIMLLGLNAVKYLINFNSVSQKMAIIEIIIFTLIGFVIYAVCILKSKTLNEVFDVETLDKLKRKLKIK